MKLLLRMTLKCNVFDERQVAQAQEWLTMLEGTRRRGPRLETYNEDEMAKEIRPSKTGKGGGKGAKAGRGRGGGRGTAAAGKVASTPAPQTAATVSTRKRRKSRKGSDSDENEQEDDDFSDDCE